MTGLLCAMLLTACGSGSAGEKKEVKEFTAFIAVPGETIEKDNRVQELIARKIGAKADVEWLTWQNAQEKVESMIHAKEYPDFLNGAEATGRLVEEGVYIPLDEYLDDYPNLKNYLTADQWESLRQEDGHIYFIPPFGVYHIKDMAVIQSGEAFWIQKRVLEWAGWPKVVTLDDYFALIEAYQKEHPLTDGKETIGYEILCDDWRYFCLENPPMFLAGFPNDGCAIVDVKTKKAHQYDTIPEAHQYFKKVSEMYSKGLVDEETFTLSYNQYIEKIESGRVLGMVDQYWEFMPAQNNLYASGKDEYTYVPLPIVANEEIKPDYFCNENQLNTGSGMGITVSCQDVEGALQFLDDLLTPEIMKLRYWGVEGTDYMVDEDGLFYRTEEMRARRNDLEYQKQNFCDYSYFPHYQGMLEDGINACVPSEQPKEYFETLSDYDKKVLEAYGHQTWSDFLGEQTKGEVWFPLYSCLSLWTQDAEYKVAKDNIDRIKREWLPKLIMTPGDEFDEVWEEYVQTYESEVNVAAYEEELDAEIQRRIERSEAVNKQ
ncbi:MAG: extracellular solute-binding protein [Lachnospiraceae bacterium]|nr:extracellular solute-binding protein [Lachnospiraceae bacterium]